MDKNQAKTIIKDTFESRFDKLKFKRFIINLLNIKSSMITDPGVKFNINQIPNTYHPFIDSFEKIAEYKFDKDKIDILSIKLKKETSIERARTMQRNFVAWYLKGGCDGEFKDSALAAFISPDENDWRFSLVKMDYSLGEDKNGRPKISEKLTPAKRWSFLVGANEKSHTAQSQLIDIVAIDDKDITLDQLEEAFDVEKVTKEFFKKYRELFLKTKEALDKILLKDARVKSDFESKNISTVDFSKKLLGQIVFLYFLQKKGWFGVARDADWGTGPKNFLQELFRGKHGKYKNFFNDILEPLFYNALRIDRSANDDYHDKFNCKIPFLNGGLFDPIGEYSWVHTDINLPNELFSNDELTKEGDKGTGILDIFDRYNFTVKEDEPLEKEVAVDPEMLGKVFENLLEVKDRKSKGTYYTPREIVHYMCQQSLINYLATELEGRVSEDDIELLFKYGEQFGGNNAELVDNLGGDGIPESIIENAELIDNKLYGIKVCDPAVGSGAFLVGIMTEIVRIRNILSNYINDSNITIYNFKRDCIENCLYGVDIDPGAVEIAKLRLWLSLVVDEEDIKKIKPLPNLDYKIVCGNSLMSIEKNLFNQELFSELESLKKKFFDEVNSNEKKKLKEKINEMIIKITDGHKEFDFEVFFSEVFHNKGGFDVVIANPPYIDSETMVRFMPRLRDNIIKNYKTAKGNWDLYIPFWEISFNLINNKGNAVLITPNKWLAINYGKVLRKLLSPYISKVGNCDQVEVFKAGNSPVIVFVNKYFTERDVEIDFFDTNYNIGESFLIKHDIFYRDQWGFILSKNFELPLKIMKNQQNVGCYYYVENPFTVSEAYEVKEILIDLKSLENFDKLKYFKFVNTGTIEKYYFLWSLKKTTYLKKKFKIPVINKDLFQKKFPKRFAQMSVPKIIISGIRHFECAFDPEGDIVAGKSTIILRNKNEEGMEVILALLNSRLMSFYIKEVFNVLGINGGINFTAELIKNLPLPMINNQSKKILSSIVSKMLKIIQNKDWIKDFKLQTKIEEYKYQIDQIIYKLYSLNEKEIKIIEES